MTPEDQRQNFRSGVDWTTMASSRVIPYRSNPQAPSSSIIPAAFQLSSRSAAYHLVILSCVCASPLLVVRGIALAALRSRCW